MATKVIVELLMLVSISAIFLAHQACGEPDCHTEKLLVMIHCRRTIKHNGAYHFPTVDCIEAIQKSDIPCVCHILDQDDEKKISAEKLVTLARQLGKTLQTGSKCGSYTVPPPHPQAKGKGNESS
ncbi:hypothetical protein BDA96_03G356800 [Sorghum bicolor]|uniref:Bifunctional inhibitor/plant lipid transfer protein/seed storage helical domain-containing protein n=1 Tax=Sorghum bicolor TaxID=4558 RepID=A0A921RI76_SORBI|nr:hypothetical protein BDA96_03G356800 [Sorghum bicolor]